MTNRGSVTIENRDRINRGPSVDLALDCLTAGIAAADPAIGINKALSLDGTTLTVQGDQFDLNEYDRILIIGGGNAAGYATIALEEILGDAIDEGVVVTDNPVETAHVEIFPGDHPIPSERGIESTRKLLALASQTTERDLVIAPITGGGSALLTAPDHIDLEELQATTEALLASGATIHEVNAVRKHLSNIKGGQLARQLAPATTIGLLCSDVVGDDRSVIASGPLTPDDSTYADALAVIDHYGVEVPEAVRDRICAGVNGDLTETPRCEAKIFDRVHTYIVASNATATAAAAEIAHDKGFVPHVLGSRFRGRAQEVAKVLVGIAEEVSATGTPLEPPAILISGGETTVEVAGDGTGGPNQELVVSAALELEDPAITVAAVDTDGIDGNTEAAGGVVTSETVDDRPAARDAIERNDTGPYLETRGASIRTGPTMTNVNDLHVVVVSDRG